MPPNINESTSKYMQVHYGLCTGEKGYNGLIMRISKLCDYFLKVG